MIHNSCNMAIRDLPDMYTLIPRACGPRASGIHIRQIPHGHVTTIKWTPVLYIAAFVIITPAGAVFDCLHQKNVLTYIQLK